MNHNVKACHEKDDRVCNEKDDIICHGNHYKYVMINTTITLPLTIPVITNHLLALSVVLVAKTNELSSYR